MKNFDEMLAQDREFTVGGETFHWCYRTPEALVAFDPVASVDMESDNAGIQIIDNRIMQFLSDSDQERWREVRSRTEEPLITLGQLKEIAEWLLEVQSERPTQAPSPSASGRAKTAATSKAA